MHNYMPHQPPNQYRQLRPQKTPLYVPAVLRPTEFPAKQSPMTPPKSLHGSLDSLEGADVDAVVSAARTDLDLAMHGDWIEDEELGNVTGPPNREHWKPDEASPTCDSAQCRSSFNLFVRKHHCRHCGHIFCSNHTAFTAPLDQEARFHPDGYPSRVCDTCHTQFERWDTARSIRRKNSNDTETCVMSQPPTPLGAPGSTAHRRTISGHSLGGKTPEQAASSVPRDWAWSTF
jgi:hypothetical protein